MEADLAMLQHWKTMRITVAWIFTVWVQPLPLWRSWGSSSRWRRRRPAGRPERSAQPTASCPGKRPPEESEPRSSLEDKLDVWVFFLFIWGAVKLQDHRLVKVTVEDLDQADHNDETQSHEFPHGEDVLDPGGHTNTGAVHPGQQHWNTETSGHSQTTVFHYFFMQMLALCTLKCLVWKQS